MFQGTVKAQKLYDGTKREKHQKRHCLPILAQCIQEQV